MPKPLGCTLLALRLASLGFLIQCKPSEPFLTLYLNETKHLSESQLANEVYPWSTIGAFAFLLPLALLSEVIGCRTVILLGLVCREATRVILVFGEGVRTMAAMQLTYSAGAAVDAIYFAYVYTVAPTSQFASLTSIVLAAYHAGNVLGSLVAEALVDWLEPAWRRDLTPLFLGDNLDWAAGCIGVAGAAALAASLSRAPPVQIGCVPNGARARCPLDAARLSPLALLVRPCCLGREHCAQLLPASACRCRRPRALWVTRGGDRRWAPHWRARGAPRP
jgi:hypothetical protein